MQDKKRNIYQIARTDKGITQEKAAELLCVSVESIRAYESGRTVPPNDIVCAMIEVYGTQYLAYQHLMHTSGPAQLCLPPVQLKDLLAAMARLQKEVDDFLPCRDELWQITYKGVIADKDQPRYEAIMSELDDIVAAVMSLKYAKQRD